MSLNIGFFGSAPFVIDFLEAIYKTEHKLKFIVTSPDKPAGRGLNLTVPEAKLFAQTHNIPVFQPEKIKEKEVIDKLNDFNCDIYVVIAYGKILPEEILYAPPLGSINLHFSLLPRWRGAAPVQWAIMSGDKVTGITIMKMDKGLDTGDILLQREIAIEDDDDSESIFNKMIEEGKPFLIDGLEKIGKRLIKPVPQDNSKATYARILRKEDGLIDWHKKALEIHNKVRALKSWPGAFSFIDVKRIVILKTKVIEGSLPSGRIEGFEGDGLLVGTSDKILKLLEIKEEGKKALSAKDFYNGRKDILGKTFGN